MNWDEVEYGSPRNRSKTDLNSSIRYSSTAGKLSERIEFTDKVKFAAPPKKKKKTKKLQYYDLVPKEILALHAGTSLEELDSQRKASGFKASKVKPKKSSNVTSVKKNVIHHRPISPKVAENVDKDDDVDVENENGNVIYLSDENGRENIDDNVNNKGVASSSSKVGILKPKTKTDKKVIVKDFLNQKRKVVLTISQFCQSKDVPVMTLKQWIVAYTKGQLDEKKKNKEKA